MKFRSIYFNALLILAYFRRFNSFAENISPTKINLFHLAWTTSAESFKCWRIYVILSIQRTYQDQPFTIYIHSNSLNDQILAKCSEHDKIITSSINYLPINYKIFKDTPMYDWWNQHKEFHNAELPALKDDFRYSHLTDIVRFAVLWRYGGTYLDFDMLLLRPLGVFRNSFAAQKDDKDELTKDDSDPYNFAFAIFEPQHPFLLEVMGNISRVYDPKLWPCVGPRLITSGVNEWSSRNLVEFHKELPMEAISNTSTSVHVFPHIYFYPLYWKFGASLVQRNESSKREFNRLISSAVTLHIWSRSTNMSTIEKGSTLHMLLNYIRENSRRKGASLKSRKKIDLIF